MTYLKRQIAYRSNLSAKTYITHLCCISSIYLLFFPCRQAYLVINRLYNGKGGNKIHIQNNGETHE